MAKSKLANSNPSFGGSPRDQSTYSESENIVRQTVQHNLEVGEKLSSACISSILEAARIVSEAVLEGRKVLAFGNGGSAADAQHLAAELVGKFGRVRRPLKALALTTDTSVLTALGNDFGFEEIYSRQVKAFADKDDVVIAISTSGRSRNVLRGVEEARKCSAKTIGLTGAEGGDLMKMCDHIISIPSDDVQRIQECHVLVSHIICELVERALAEQE